jgi:hypothetical protein
MSDNQEQFTPEYSRPTAEARKPIDRYLAMTLRYNYLAEKREADKPDLYGPGIDFYEEEKLRREHGGL